jgi:excinuclease UvrABC nuclease subunit
LLDLHDNYQAKLEDIQDRLQKEQEHSRRLNEQMMRFATEKEFELAQARGEA